MSAADPFQELVDTLKRILTRSPSPPLPASTSTPVTSAINSSSPVMFASPMARPAPYSGDPEECNGFLLQCSLTIDLHPQMFLTDQAKIAFVITSLTGPALRWAESVLNQAGPATHSYGQFLAHFREVFSSSPGDSSVGEQLYKLRQGSMTIHQYTLKFRTLAAASGWNEPSLITAFRQGLNPRLRLHLAAYDDTHGLEKFIQLAIRCSNRIEACPSDAISVTAIVTPPKHQPEARDPPEAMQTDLFRLTPGERQRRLTRGLCLYCGGDDHHIQACTIRPPRLLVSGIRPPFPKMNPLTTCAHLIINTNLLPVTVLLDSGSAGNFISGSLCQQLHLTTTATETTYQIQTITGTPLTRRLVKSCVGPLQLRMGLLHQESIQLLVLEEATVDIILGLPWLVKHDPVISWRSGDVLKWGSDCFPRCFPQLPRPTPSVSVQLPLQATSIESPVDKQSVEWLCLLQGRLLPQESLTTSTSSAMGLCHRPSSGWASTAG